VLAAPAPASAWENDLGEVSLSESGGLSDRTLQALGTFSDVLGVRSTVMQSGTIRMTRVDRQLTTVQSFDPGFAVPMAFTAVDPAGAAPLLGPEITAALAGGVVMSDGSAGLRDARVGDEITLEGWNGTLRRLQVTAIVPDEAISWSELVLSVDLAAELGIDRPSRAVMWGVNTTVVDFLARAVLADAPIRVSGPGSESRPFVDWVLPMVQVKERFGEFSYRETGTDRIETDDTWYEANIITVVIPQLGQFRCHREVLPFVMGALGELETRGLVGEIDMDDFQLAGGCYNARLARGGDLNRGFALSRHSWGIAIDFNPSTNQFGEESTLSDEFGDVLRAWGFAWGAGWRVSDPMHFEWHALPEDVSRSDCATRLAATDPAGDGGWVEPVCP